MATKDTIQPTFYAIQPKTVHQKHGMWHREGSANSDMGSRASLRDDDIAQAEVVVESARQAVGELMRKIEQVRHASIPHTKLSRLGMQCSVPCQ